jgi:hypothetical protein
MLNSQACPLLRLRSHIANFFLKMGLALLLCIAGAMSTSAQTNAFLPTGGMVTNRTLHTATLLSDGKVLIAGGSIYTSASTPSDVSSSAETFDATTGAFASTGNMTAQRSSHTATLLRNGKVLITGGQNADGVLTSAELFDPAAGTFTSTGSMTTARSYHTATLLADGRVLLVGGADNNGSVASAEIYDPATGTFAATGSMATARASHSATPLNTGKILIAGGENNSTAQLASAEVYDPSSGTFSATGSMVNPRYSHTATLLNTGKVLVAGGWGVSTMGNCEETPVWNTAELYDPTAGTFTATGSMSTPRYLHTATLLNNNLVLIVAGNMGPSFNPDCVLEYPPFLASSEIFDPTTGTFAGSAQMSPNNIFVDADRDNHTATLLQDGTVLVAGGTSSNGFPVPSAMLYGPSFASVYPENLEFASQEVGVVRTDWSLQLTLQNNGSAPLNITQITINGVNPSDFGQTSNCVGSEAVGAQCTIEVTFAPSATGLRAANIVIINANDAAHAMKVPVTGTGTPYTPPTATVSVSPTSLSFTPQYVGTSSAQQTVTVTNISKSPVGVTPETPSSPDFVLVNNCVNTLPPNGTCTVLVSFDPTTSGVRTGTITFNDNSPAGFQSVGLAGVSGTGQDFSMAAGSGGGATVSPGKTATYSLSLAPGGGFAQSVSLTCSGGPAMSTCSVSPSSIALNGTASQTATVSVTTSSQGLSPIPSDLGGNVQRQIPLALVQVMTGIVFLLWMASKWRRWRFSRAIALAALACVVMSLSSCGGSAGGHSATSATQSGTYTITVTGNFTSGTASLKHTTKFTLVVQ